MDQSARIRSLARVEETEHEDCVFASYVAVGIGGSAQSRIALE